MTTRPWLALVALAVAACSDDDAPGDPLGVVPQFPVPGCEHIEHSPCNVTDARCQERLLGLAACLRGSEPGSVPPVTLMTEQEYAAYVSDQFAADPPEDPPHYEEALVLLGLAKSGALSQSTLTADALEHVWGVYRDDTDDVLLIDHGFGGDVSSASNVLVHEFVHVLQDREIDLTAFRETHSSSVDSMLAARGAVEGEARFHQTRYWASLLGLNPAEIDWRRRLQQAVELSETWVLEQPSPYTAMRQVFQYEWGARNIGFVWETGGRTAVRERLDAPPKTTHTLLASVDGAASPELEGVPVEAPLPPAEWTLLHDTTQGAWCVFLLLASSGGAEPAHARELALAWRGDRFTVYSGAIGTAPDTAVVWELVFADASGAAAVDELAKSLVPAVGVVRTDARLVIAASKSGRPLDWAFVE
jgi:hypothetical protein